MFLDASAIVAILNEESDAQALIDCIESAPAPLIVSPLVRFEAIMSLARARAAGRAGAPRADAIAQATISVDLFLTEVEAEEMPINGKIGRAAVAAGARYGKAVGHSAGLNFGDCFAYACATERSVALLFKGDDFSQTDVTSGLRRASR
jgi:ribonuclease VapC